MAKRKKVRRAKKRRQTYGRRKGDFYRELGKFGGLIGFTSAAIVGQAELIGEPWRHYFTVSAIVGLAVWAYGMKPESLKSVMELYQQFRKRRGM